jgi:acyl dehydratase
MLDKKWIGQTFPSSTLVVERGRLQFFAKAIGETDPVYTDLAVAKAAGYPDLPAPPTFLFSAELDSGESMAMLDRMGINIGRILHGEESFTYYKPVCAGDTIVVTPRIEDIYDKKNGALEFIVKKLEAKNQHNELVAEMGVIIVVRN